MAITAEANTRLLCVCMARITHSRIVVVETIAMIKSVGKPTLMRFRVGALHTIKIRMA
jgi:hypothetical protein